MSKKITFVVAPGIPLTERMALQRHVQEAWKDDGYTVVTNYLVETVKLEPDEFLLLTAVGVPDIEVAALRSQIDKVHAREIPPILVVNYEVDLNVVSKSE